MKKVIKAAPVLALVLTILLSLISSGYTYGMYAEKITTVQKTVAKNTKKVDTYCKYTTELKVLVKAIDDNVAKIEHKQDKIFELLLSGAN